MIGVQVGDDVRGRMKDTLLQLPDFSVCPQPAADVNNWIRKISDDSIRDFDKDGSGELDVEEMSNFIFEYFGVLMHSCWLRPAGALPCDALPPITDLITGERI